MTPALAGEKTLQVTATILPRNACVLNWSLAELRCTGPDAKVLYRVIREADNGETHVSTPATAPRNQGHRIVVGRNGMVTIEF